MQRTSPRAGGVAQRTHRALIVAVATTMALAAVAALAGPAAAIPGPTPAPILVYNGNDSRQSGETYAGFGTATGRPISSTTTLPSELRGTACVILNLNQQVFDAGQVSTISNYLQRGGAVLMIGEWNGYAAAADTTLSALSTAVGSSMQFNGSSADPGSHTTTNVSTDPLTVGVNSIHYAYTGLLSFSGTARGLVRTTSNGGTFIAAQQIGAGRLIMSGDSNMWLGPSGDDAVLVRNICGTRRATTTTVQCTPAQPDVGATATCTANVIDVDTGAPSTPTGTATFSTGDPSTGAFPNGSTCTLAPGATAGSASCSVSYTVLAPGARTVEVDYSGDGTVESASASDDLTGVTPAPTPTPTPAPAPDPTTTTTTATSTTPAATTSAAPPVPRATVVCVSTRKLTLHWTLGTSVRALRRMTVSINGGAPRALKSSTRQMRLDLSGRGAGTQTVRLLATAADGTTLGSTRVYQTCTQTKNQSSLATLVLQPARRAS